MSKKNDVDAKEKPKPVVARSIVDVQRIKLEKLMKNPEKPIVIPTKAKERGVPTVPDFVRNVMGSSAGAGSGEFHVYRHLRRKEYARQYYMTEKAKYEKMEDAYHSKVDENKRKADDLTARKRAKRLKKKQSNKKGGGNKKTKSPSPSPSESSEDESSKEDNPEDEAISTNIVEEIINETDDKENEDVSMEVVRCTNKPNDEKIINETDDKENEDVSMEMVGCTNKPNDEEITNESNDTKKITKETNDSLIKNNEKIIIMNDDGKEKNIVEISIENNILSEDMEVVGCANKPNHEECTNESNETNQILKETNDSLSIEKNENRIIPNQDEKEENIVEISSENNLITSEDGAP